MGWLAVGTVAAVPAVETVRIVAQRSKVVLYGDQALLALGARRAAHLDQLVGPYSREGFHHPGPAVFYLLAPFVRILGANGPGLYLGALAISGGALIATVAFLWRHLGPPAALWAATAIDLYCLCLRVGTLREPWNPYLVVTPMVLFVVLWAAGITGSRGAALWALVVGSYEVQTHIATAGFVVTMSVVLMGWTTVSARRAHRIHPGESPRWGPARLSASAALLLIWLPPVIELWRDRPNNINLLWDFFSAAHSGPNVGQALKVTANALTIMPFGYHDYSLSLSRSNTDLGIGAVLMVLGLVVAVVLGVRRSRPLSLALSASGVLGVVLGWLSLSLTGGPVFLYFAVWLAYVPLMFLLAIGTALLPSGRPRELYSHTPQPHSAVLARPVAVLFVVAAVVTAGFSVRSDLSMASVATSNGAGPWPAGADGTPAGRSLSPKDTAALARAAQSVLGPTDRRVGFTIGTPSLWPYVAGMVLELDERGVQSTVSPSSWTLYFGHERAPGRPVDVQFDLFTPTAAARGTTAAGTVLAQIDGNVLTYQRTTGPALP